jgi:hypothetical protein
MTADGDKPFLGLSGLICTPDGKSFSSAVFHISKLQMDDDIVFNAHAFLLQCSSIVIREYQKSHPMCGPSPFLLLKDLEILYFSNHLRRPYHLGSVWHIDDFVYWLRIGRVFFADWTDGNADG